MLRQRSYEILFYVSFVCGHYFLQYKFMQVCIFYLFFWKPRFLSINVSCFLLWKIRTFEREFVLQTCSCIFENFWNMQPDVITYGSICGKYFMICTCSHMWIFTATCFQTCGRAFLTWSMLPNISNIQNVMCPVILFSLYRNYLSKHWAP